MADIIGIGTDITECDRIRKMLDKHGTYFLDRVYTDWEIEYCSPRKQSIEHYTGRWAAKEAVLKAIGTGWIAGIAWRDMEVRNEEGGKPYIVTSGGVQKVVEELGITEIQISISHCQTHATAFAVAVRK